MQEGQQIMRVALSFPRCNRRGGIERVIYECARYLSERGHEVTVFANRYEPSGAAVSYHHVPMPRTLKMLKPLAFHRACTAEMLEDQFDVHGAFGVDCPAGGVYWAGAVHAAWLEKAKALRSTWSLAAWKQRLNPVHSMVLRLEEQHCSPGGYRRIIAMTEEMKSDLHRHYDVPAKDVELVPGGYSPEEFNLGRTRELRDPVRRELGFAADDRVILFVANELQRKGYPSLLRAVDAMNDERLKILVAGRIAPSPHPRVKYIGSISNVARCYAAADVFALPTRYEAWGLVIIEALASGLPVLTSRLAGASVAVREGASGNLLEVPTDEGEIVTKLRPLIEGQHSSPEEIETSVAEYTWSRVLPKYEKILRAMVA
jgi:UDP-glucose:(heptosyl)LPS alpha-1,3-glucosyltransferase